MLVMLKCPLYTFLPILSPNRGHTHLIQCDTKEYLSYFFGSTLLDKI